MKTDVSMGSARSKCFVVLVGWLFLFGCTHIPESVEHGLAQAGKNRRELLKVIDHYKKEADSAKLEAVYYLISHLPGKQSSDGYQFYSGMFDQVMDSLDSLRSIGASLQKETPIKKIYPIYNRLYDSLIRLDTNGSQVFMNRDLHVIKAEFLIKNIELAFKAFYQMPALMRCGKEDFLRYVLPYGLNDEPIEEGLRSKFLAEYHWVFERMESGVSMQGVVCELMEDLDIHSFGSMRFPGPVPVSETKRLKIATCDNKVTLAVMVLRSVGIPATMDFVPHWGNHHEKGHSWLSFFIGDSTIAIDPIKRQHLVQFYNKERVPKVYRRAFSSEADLLHLNTLDVTGIYAQTADISMDVQGVSGEYNLLVFNKENGWRSVDKSSKMIEESVTFDQVGTNIIYSMSSENSRSMTLDPFYIDINSNVRPLTANHDQLVDAVLTRKYPSFFVRYPKKMVWIESLNGTKIQAANQKDFSDAIDLFELHHISSSNPYILKDLTDKSFRYYRLKSDSSQNVHLADFHVLDSDFKIMKSKAQLFDAEGKQNKTRTRKVTDADPLSYHHAVGLSVVHAFKKPKDAKYFRVQPRNDDNNIRIGEEYELMYWDGGWQSAGVQYAEDTMLIYKEIPSGSAYWLRNHTKGKEEHLFMLDAKGNQLWPGVNFPYNYFSHDLPPSICQ